MNEYKGFGIVCANYTAAVIKVQTLLWQSISTAVFYVHFCVVIINGSLLVSEARFLNQYSYLNQTLSKNVAPCLLVNPYPLIKRKPASKTILALNILKSYTKTFLMTASIFQKEILLVANAGFFSKHWVERNSPPAGEQATQREILVDACWNGQAPDILPECFDVTADKGLSLWEARYTGAFICLHFWDGEKQAERGLALNPYIFLEAQELN